MQHVLQNIIAGSQDKDYCGDRTGGHAGCQEVSRCSTRGGSREHTLRLPPQKSE